MEAQGIYCAHWVNLTDTLLGVDRMFHYIGSNFTFASRWKVQSQQCITARSFSNLKCGSTAELSVTERRHRQDGDIANHARWRPNVLINIAHKARMYLRLKSEPLEH